MNKKNYSILFMFLLFVAVVIAGCQDREDITGKALKSTDQNIITSDNETNCTDSDGGINIYVKGTCSNNNNMTNFTDYCYGNLRVFEYFCGDPNATGNTTCQVDLIGCPSGYKCSGGRCIRTLSRNETYNSSY